LLYRTGIGSGMTRNFVICSNQHPINIHGIKYIGNFGYGPQLIFGDHSRSPISPELQHANVFVQIFSPEERVGHFMTENIAKGVSSNTFAINVEQNTQQLSAPYQPLNSDLVELN